MEVTGSWSCPKKIVPATITSILMMPKTFTSSILAVTLAIFWPLTTAGVAAQEPLTIPDTFA